MVTVAVDVGFFLFRCCCSKESSVALCMKLSSPKSNNYLNDKCINIHNSFGYSKLQIFVLSFSEYINHEPFGRLIILFIFRFFSFFIISVVTEQSCLWYSQCKWDYVLRLFAFRTVFYLICVCFFCFCIRCILSLFLS